MYCKYLNWFLIFTISELGVVEVVKMHAKNYEQLRVNEYMVVKLKRGSNVVVLRNCHLISQNRTELLYGIKMCTKEFILFSVINTSDEIRSQNFF